MDTKIIKLYALEYIDAHNISNDKKISLMEFVSEASREDVINFLMTGNTKKLNDDVTLELNMIFENSFIGNIISDINDFSIEADYLFESLLLEEPEEPDEDSGSGGGDSGGGSGDSGGGSGDSGGGSGDSGGGSGGGGDEPKVDDATKTQLAQKISGIWNKIKAYGSTVDKVIKDKSQVAIDAIKNNPGKAATIGAIVAAAGLLGTVLYKKYMNNASKACSGAPDKAACIKKYKLTALSNKLKAYNENKALCKQSKDPAGCIAKMNEKIIKVKEEMATLKK